MASEANQPHSFTDIQHSTATTESNRSNAMPVISEEERRVLKECERDSFFLRALPCSIGAMVGAFLLVKQGRWAAHPKFGALPKMIITGGFGYFAGKISYLPTCQRKVLEQIPNSNLAAAIRKSKGLSQPEGEQISPALDDSVVGSNKYKEYRPSEGIDDRFRPSMDREVKEPSANQEKSSITYDELRRRNRQEYDDSTSKRPQNLPPASTPPYRDSPFIPEKHLPESREPPKSEFDTPTGPPAPPRGKRTTVWGDVIED